MEGKVGRRGVKYFGGRLSVGKNSTRIEERTSRQKEGENREGGGERGHSSPDEKRRGKRGGQNTGIANSYVDDWRRLKYRQFSPRFFLNIGFRSHVEYTRPTHFSILSPINAFNEYKKWARLVSNNPPLLSSRFLKNFSCETK